jgi:hypothetical protein
VCEADYWSPSSAQIQNEWIYASPLHNSLMLYAVITLFCDWRINPPAAGSWHHVTAFLLTLCNFRLGFNRRFQFSAVKEVPTHRGKWKMHIYISHVLSHISAHASKRCRKAVAKGDCQLMRVCSSVCPAVSPACHSATHSSSVLLRADTAHDTNTHTHRHTLLPKKTIYDLNTPTRVDGLGIFRLTTSRLLRYFDYNRQ